MHSKQFQIAALCDSMSKASKSMNQTRSFFNQKGIINVYIMCEVKRHVLKPTKYCRLELLIIVVLSLLWEQMSFLGYRKANQLVSQDKRL